MENILVSICCTTYNHEKFIEQTLLSFLNQKTDFSYEILIHDDASTDRTVSIIEKYHNKYPEIIKPIYQKQNKYSQGIAVNEYNYGRAVGKYIAFCEGDDYWTDILKLQEQIDYMEKDSECSVCVHASQKINAETGKVVGYMRPSNYDTNFSVSEVIDGDGDFVATNSMVFRRKYIDMPEFCKKYSIGDYPKMIYFSLMGRVHYINKVMSAYRVGVQNSWTNRTFGNKYNLLVHYNEKVAMLNEINGFSDYEFDDMIKKNIKKIELDTLLLERQFEKAKSNEYKLLFDSFSNKRKIYTYIDQYFPILTEKYRKIKYG